MLHMVCLQADVQTLSFKGETDSSGHTESFLKAEGTVPVVFYRVM